MLKAHLPAQLQHLFSMKVHQLMEYTLLIMVD